jgi:hypothetical protein
VLQSVNGAKQNGVRQAEYRASIYTRAWLNYCVRRGGSYSHGRTIEVAYTWVYIQATLLRDGALLL